MVEGRRLADVDLRGDAAAQWVTKDELVMVEFAVGEGMLQSAVGVNRYAAGDALLTGATGDRWCVSRDRFDSKYRAVPSTRPGQGGRYRNHAVAVLAKQMPVPFSVARSAGGDVLCGSAGDWLMQYAPGDFGIVARARFDQVYRTLPVRT
jgi:hypothetical protein